MRLKRSGHLTTCQLPVLDPLTALMDETPDEALWLAVPGSLYRLKGGASPPFIGPGDGMPQSRPSVMTHDREGYIQFTTDREGIVWVGTLNHGINRLNRRVVTSISTAAGLASDPDAGISTLQRSLDSRQQL